MVIIVLLLYCKTLSFFGVIKTKTILLFLPI